MKIRVKVPKVGLTVEEVTLSTWEKQEGDAVAAEETIATVEGDKATFEVTSPAAGKLLKKLAVEGDVVPVGGEIALVEIG
ncbi:biotin/lipoyl-containing protein [Xanthobacter sp. V3C-3]|uniref:biotin/lipoyl-containing protein n=1 Tax=Xanthobacter lutulentifluminis TaxID=3119935 RepID=UPI0037281778